MKKILLGTTALIGAATVLAGAALADDPKVTVGGFNNFEAAFVKDNNDSNQRDRAFRNDTEVHFNVAGKTDQGLGYGAEIDLQADIDGNNTGNGSTNQGLVAHRTYAWLQGDNWGHFEYGSNDGAARTLKVDASNIARATGGIDGDWSLFANTNAPASPSGATNGPASLFAPTNTGGTGFVAGFITAPRLPVEHGPTSSYVSDVWGNDSKVTYYTPRFSGLQLGVSYAPDLANRGELTNRFVQVPGSYGDIFEGGVNYEGQFDQVGFAAAATGEVGHDDTGTVNNIRAWNAGAKVSLAGFSFAGSYGDWLSSLSANGTGTKSDYWTAGVAYETGPVGASVTYLGSRVKPNGYEDKLDDISVGVDYKLAPGLTPFAEYTWFDLNASGTGAAGTDKGNVVIVGSQLSF